MIKLLAFLGLISIAASHAVVTSAKELLEAPKSGALIDGSYENLVPGGYSSFSYVTNFSPFEHLETVIQYPEHYTPLNFVPIKTSSGHFTYLPSYYSTRNPQEQLFAQTLQELLADPEFADIRPSVQPGNIPTPLGPFGDFLEFIAKAIRRLIERRRKEQEAERD